MPDARCGGFLATSTTKPHARASIRSSSGRHPAPESNFRKYAILSRAGARLHAGDAIWVRLIGATDHNLFNLRTNLRYGCVIRVSTSTPRRATSSRALAATTAASMVRDPTPCRSDDLELIYTPLAAKQSALPSPVAAL
jgi:hypothetical protein